MKSILKQVYKKTGKTYRLLNQLQCDQCGAVTYAQGPAQTDRYMHKSCDVCDTLATAKRRGILDIVFDRVKAREIRKRLADGSKTRQINHGLTHTKLYKRWLNMLARCYDSQSASYPEYGGRGITVCDEWLDFSNFFWHLGEVPIGMELDRVDNDYIYCPENVRWATHDENVSNRRKSFKRGTQRSSYGWWLDLGIKNNPYVYGPMPWKRTALKWRIQEAIERGWHVPRKKK